jgi:ssDNA-binding Zn-finger/Zn-ribbon topoisomerase 1
MREWTTQKGKLFLVCKRYPTCDTCGTVSTIEALARARRETEQVESQLAGVQERFMSLSDKFRDTLDGKRREHVPLPLKLGDYVTDVAKVAIVRSQKKQERKREQIRLEADKAPGELPVVP